MLTLVQQGQSGSISDHQLVADSAAGDERAFARLVGRHAEKIRAIALRYTNDMTASEDIVQEVFWRVWRAKDKWDADGEATFSSWLYRVTLNLCTDRARRRKARSWFSGFGVEADSAATPEPGPERVIGARQDLAIVQADIANLPDKQKAALLLSALAGEPNAVIAATMGTSIGAVEQAISRARRTLREKKIARENSERG